MKNKTSKRRTREYLAHRNEILVAAEKVFAAKGFFTTKMMDIAQEAEFGTGTLYTYFKSKEELFFTLFNEKMEAINHLIKYEFSRMAPAKEKIRGALKSLFEFIEKNRDFFRIFLSEQNLTEWTIKEDFRKGIHLKRVTYINLLAKVMRQGIQEKAFKSINPMDMACSLLGMVNSFVLEWLISKKYYPIASKLETLLEIFLGGVQRIERRR